MKGRFNAAPAPWMLIAAWLLSGAYGKDGLRSRTHHLRAIEIDAPAIEAGELVDFLAGDLCNATAAPMLLETFVPLCVTHVQKLIRQLDRSYTDTHLKQVLEHECWLKEQFPVSHPGHGFPSNITCTEFAAKLTNARDLEQKNDTACGYTSFCQEYYDLTMKGNCTQPVAAPAPPVVKAGFNPLWAWLVLGLIIAVIAGAFAYSYKGA